MKRHRVFEPARRHPSGSAAHWSPMSGTRAHSSGTAITQNKTAELITQGRLATAQSVAGAWIDASPRMLALRRHAAALQREGGGLRARRPFPVQRKLTGSGENLTETQLGKVKKLDEFNVGDKKFVVLKKVSPPNEESKEAHEIYVHNIAGDNNIPYSEWIKQPWRTWTGDLEKGGESKERKDMPPSTASIPLTLYKRVNVDHLDSISKTPLESTPQRIVFQGYSKGSKYMTRDLAIAAVWLGKSTQPGESMQPVTGRFIDLKITVSPTFRDAYLRDVYAVLHGNDEKVSDTVLCFAPIVPGMVAVTLTENDMMLIKSIDAKTRLKVGDNVLSRIDSKDIKNIIAALTTGGNEDD